MNIISAGELTKGRLIIVKNEIYSITGISSFSTYNVSNKRLGKKIVIVALHRELNKKIELIYPETYKLFLEDNGKINLDKTCY
jgi:hypothetical protein